MENQPHPEPWRGPSGAYSEVDLVARRAYDPATGVVGAEMVPAYKKL
jgi:hypothetical protein